MKRLATVALTDVDSPPVPAPPKARTYPSNESMFAEFYRIFGEVWDGPIFQSPDAGWLRFELSAGEIFDGESAIDLFTRAYDRSRAILGRALRDAKRLTVVLNYWFRTDWDGRPHVPSELAYCEIPLPQVCHTWTVVDPDPSNDTHEYLLFQCDKSMMARLLWGALGREMGIRPAFQSFKLGFADLDNGIFVYPYDDRGMDLFGPNKQLLRELYSEFNGYLLESHRQRMQEVFGDPLPENSTQ